MKVVKNLAISFIENHFEELNLEKCDLKGYNKKQVINQCKKEYWFACWVITELMSWGLDKDYLSEYVVEHEGDFLVIKIKDKYYRINFQTHCFDEAEVKIKTVYYFD